MPTDQMPEHTVFRGQNDVVVRDLSFMDRGNLEKPVVPLTGWMKYVGDDPRAADMVRLYIDPCFEEWLEIPANSVVTYISGNIRPGDGRSMVWVLRDTMVTKWTARTAQAGAFALRELESQGLDEAPGDTAGYGGRSAPPRP